MEKNRENKFKTIFRSLLLNTKTQIYVGIIILLVFILLAEKNKFTLCVKVSQFADFLKIIASIIGTIGAIMIAFFLFFCQLIDGKRQDFYYIIQKEIDKLREILYAIPSDFSNLIKPVTDYIDFFSRKKIRDYPIDKSEWESLYKQLQTTLKNCNNINPRIPLQIFASLLRIENYLSEMGIIYVETIIGGFILDTIKKFFYLVLLSMLSIFYFSIIEHSFHPQVFASVMLIFLYFACVFILEVLLHIRDYYREVSNDNGKK